MSAPQSTSAGADRPLSVTELTARIDRTLREGIGAVWVEGEISNFSRSGAGHCYFTLKDEKAQLRVVLWRTEAARLPFVLADGLAVVCLGSIEVYAQRGQYNLTARLIQPKGIGALELAFRQLRARLEAEGLFDNDRKRLLPAFPRRIALITSPRGAAIRDFLEVAGRRWRGLDIVVIPAAVQGDAAPRELINALGLAQRVPEVDVIALVRGGGSLEDLWAFNDEGLARALHASTIPIVSGVGHEVDVTIADLVADVRALTPSEAAERIFPDQRAVEDQLVNCQSRLIAALLSKWERSQARVDAIEGMACFRRPLTWMNESARRIDDLERRLALASRRSLDRASDRVASLARTLDGLSPLRVLQRGYAVALKAEAERVVMRLEDVAVGESLRVRLVDGQLRCLVTDKEEAIERS